jgi:hypothetical protein
MARMSDDDLQDALSVLRQRWQRQRHVPVKGDKLYSLMLDIEAVLQDRWATRPRAVIEQEVERELQVK